ncbi:MAG: hypothetical protein R2867_04020 [Caldilineaceae bacterium]
MAALGAKNVTVTPHIAGASREAACRGAEIVAQDIVNFFAGKPLQYCVNRQALAQGYSENQSWL